MSEGRVVEMKVERAEFSQIVVNAIHVGPTIHFDPNLPEGTYRLVEIREGHLGLEE